MTTFVDYQTPITASWLNNTDSVVTAVTSGVVTPLANFSMSGANSNSSTSTAINIDTTSGQWNAGAGRQTFSAQFTINNYFAVNPTAHFGFILRSSSTDPVNGHGVIFGTINNPVTGHATNTTALETFYPASSGGAALANYVWTPENLAGGMSLVDGGQYHLVIHSTVSHEGNKFIRAIVHKLTVSGSGNGDTFWNLIVDTGDVLDRNPWADFTKTQLSLFSVFNTSLVGWSLDFTNASVVWHPATTEVSDQSRNLTFQNGAAEVPGNLNFVGDSRRVYFAETGIDWTKWTCLQNPNANQSTSICAIPNGTATTANFFAVNNSNNASNYGGITFGMQGAYGVIQSFGVGGAANPEIVVSVGVGAVAATFRVDSLNFPGNKTIDWSSGGNYSNTAGGLYGYIRILVDGGAKKIPVYYT